MRKRFEAGVDATLGAQIERASVQDGHVQLRLRMRDGTHRDVRTDHVVAATGDRPEIDRLDFLSEPLRRALRTHTHMPVVSRSFETSVPGLYLVGPPALNSFGPLMRFMVGASTSRRWSLGDSPSARGGWKPSAHRPRMTLPLSRSSGSSMPRATQTTCRVERGSKRFVSHRSEKRCFSSPAAPATRGLSPLVDAVEGCKRIHALAPDYGANPVPRIEEIAERATGAIRERQATGPYLLGGYSFGGLIALEVARCLTAEGERVGQLFLIDAVYGERYWPRSIWLQALARRTGWHLSQISRMGATAAAREFGLRSKRLVGRLRVRQSSASPIPRASDRQPPGRPRHSQRAPCTARDTTPGSSP